MNHDIGTRIVVIYGHAHVHQTLPQPRDSPAGLHHRENVFRLALCSKLHLPESQKYVKQWPKAFKKSPKGHYCLHTFGVQIAIRTVMTRMLLLRSRGRRLGTSCAQRTGAGTELIWVLGDSDGLTQRANMA